MSATSLHTLRQRLSGAAVVSGEQHYRSARRGAGSTPIGDRAPAVVVLPETADDVARAIDFARANDLDVSVRSGGHDVFAASTTPSGVLIDLARLSAITVDPATGVARAGAGVRSGALGAAAATHRRAPVLGMNPTVGLGGLTLGGGLGWLCGAHGAAVDHLVAVELVTADGRLLTADSEQHAELFWALRGGGGNFGVATAFTYRLPPIDEVLAGTVVMRGEPRPFLRFLDELLADSPDELDVAAGVLSIGGDACTFVRGCWCGEVAAGERIFERIRQFAPIVHDDVGRRRFHDFVDVSPMSDVRSMYWRGGELARLTEPVIDAFVAVLEAGLPADCMVSLLHYVHGAAIRVPFDSTPLIREPGHIMYNVVATSTEEAPEREAIDWVNAAAASLRRVDAERTYVNYLSVDDADAVARSYGPHFARLQAVKRCYDPDNVFHHNRNIPVDATGARTD